MAAEKIKPLAFEAPENKHIKCIGDLRSLYWPLSDPPNISILSDAQDFKSPKKPYFQEHGLHPISDQSLVDPPVCSIRVEICDFVDWRERWEDRHEEHEDHYHHLFRTEQGQIVTGKKLGELEAIDDQLKWEDFSCCGDSAPTLPLFVTVHASRKPFVTVADYIAALHPFLMAHRKHFILARSELDSGPGLPNNTELMVNPLGVCRIQIPKKEKWIQYRNRNPVGLNRPTVLRAPPLSVSEIEEQRRYPAKPMYVNLRGNVYHLINQAEEVLNVEL